MFNRSTMKAVLVLFALTVAVSAKVIRAPPSAILQSELQEFHDNLKFLNDHLDTLADPEDGGLLVPELIRKYGYPAEEHVVTTDDGYVLKMHRIPHGKKGTPGGTRQIAFLMHGILSSSADWLLAGPEKSLAYILADKGYDVWMGNARGTRYSRNHTALSPDCVGECAQFWTFDWHEIGTTDLPAMIDMALETTGQEDLIYVGHSQGTTTFFVMCNEHPTYNKKIRAHFSLAPIAFMNHMTSPLLKIIALAEGGMELLLKLIGMHEFLPQSDFIGSVGNGLCGDESWLQPLCTNALFAICGFNKAQMNATMLPIIMGHTPAGTSTRQFLHFAQEINSGKFRKWDYGLIGNMKNYGSVAPPNYDLGKVTAPSYLFYSNNDWLAAKVDVVKLFDRLGNVQGKFIMSDDKWNHLDYLYAIDAKPLCYDKLVSLMGRHPL